MLEANPGSGRGIVRSTDRNTLAVDLISRILNEAPVSITYVGRDLIYKECNQEGARSMGLTRERVIGRHLHQVVPERPELWRTVEKVIGTGRSVHSLPVQVTWPFRPTDGPLHYLMSCIADKDAAGHVLGAVVVRLDVTDLVRTGERLERQTELLERLKERKDRFISIASHELKNPITTIKGYAQLLEKYLGKDKDPKLHQFAQNISLQVDKISLLINDLLDVSKIEQGKLELRKHTFDITKLIRRIATEMQKNSPRHHIRFGVRKRHEVYADEDRIGQVLINLISNAIKYSPKGGDIIVGLDDEDRALTVSVKDMGIGINKSDIPRLFSRFFRSTRSAESRISGSGLGLFICKQIIRKHGGLIWVKTKPHKGSTFYFSLPKETG